MAFFSESSVSRNRPLFLNGLFLRMQCQQKPTTLTAVSAESDLFTECNVSRHRPFFFLFFFFLSNGRFLRKRFEQKLTSFVIWLLFFFSSSFFGIVSKNQPLSPNGPLSPSLHPLPFVFFPRNALSAEIPTSHQTTLCLRMQCHQKSTS